MINKSMRCPAKDVGSAAMRLRSAAAGESRKSKLAGDISFAASATLPAAVSAGGSRCDAPRDIGDYDLDLI